jgi:NADPH:quinone reductase-like Zn-dependent oxidoreductase
MATRRLTVRRYELQPGTGIDGLRAGETGDKKLRGLYVRVAIRAATLNYRDLLIAKGAYGRLPSYPITPLSDGVGEVVEVGGEVTRFRVGDRVVTTFWPDWHDGPGSPDRTRDSYGAQLDGVLAEQLIAHEDGLVRAPDGLSDAGAAALPCAGVTAWNALFGRGRARPGDTVLILGTGGVAIWALQIAVVAGLNPIVTSSSTVKLEKAKALGARHTIDYESTPDWPDAVLDVTHGRGADIVLEVGGQDTLPRSIKATAFDGRIVVIGGLTGFAGAEVAPNDLIGGMRTLTGVSVGSRAATEELVRFVELNRIKPVVDTSFRFDDAAAAYRYLDDGRAFGKVAVTVD